MKPVYAVVKWHFHWRFWRPMACVGGPIRFGWWASCMRLSDGSPASPQSARQVAVKQDMGLIGW